MQLDTNFLSMLFKHGENISFDYTTIKGYLPIKVMDDIWFKNNKNLIFGEIDLHGTVTFTYKATYASFWFFFTQHWWNTPIESVAEFHYMMQRPYKHERFFSNFRRLSKFLNLLEALKNAKGYSFNGIFGEKGSGYGCSCDMSTPFGGLYLFQLLQNFEISDDDLRTILLSDKDKVERAFEELNIQNVHQLIVGLESIKDRC